MSKSTASGAPQWLLLLLLGFSVFSATAAGYVFFMRAPAAKEEAGHADFSRDDVRKAVEDAIEDHDHQKLTRDDSPKSKALAALDQKIVDLGQKHRALIDRLEKIAAEPPAMAKSDGPYVIPERTKVEEIVGNAILKQREDEARVEKEKEAARQKQQRDERLTRQVEELTKLLGLEGKQADQMREYLGAADQARSELFAKFGGMRPGQGGDFDPQTMRQTWQTAQDEMRAISDKTNAAIKESLNSDQYAKYEKWSEEQNPFRMRGGPGGGFGGMGGGMGGGGRNGGGTGGGNQDGGSGQAGAAEPTAVPPAGTGTGGGRRNRDQQGGRPNRRGN